MSLLRRTYDKMIARTKSSDAGKDRNDYAERVDLKAWAKLAVVYSEKDKEKTIPDKLKFRRQVAKHFGCAPIRPYQIKNWYDDRIHLLKLCTQGLKQGSRVVDKRRKFSKYKDIWDAVYEKIRAACTADQTMSNVRIRLWIRELYEAKHPVSTEEQLKSSRCSASTPKRFGRFHLAFLPCSSPGFESSRSRERRALHPSQASVCRDPRRRSDQLPRQPHHHQRGFRRR
jgi:hypothetical protein